MEFGSVNNLLYSKVQSKNPAVGMGATELLYTDRRAYTVIEVSPDGKRVKVQRDKARRRDKSGLSDTQSYLFEIDPQGVVVELSRRRDGTWRPLGQDGPQFILGVREEYYDYSF